MNEIVIKANAKINLSLDVLSKREDGYHELEMIMCEIPLFDKSINLRLDIGALSCQTKQISVSNPRE